MFQIFRIFFLTFLPLVATYAQENNIHAIVNHQTITVDEVLMRKLVTRTINGIGELSAIEEKQFTNSILQSMIQDLIINQTAQQMGLTVPKTEIEEYISSIETNNKMPPHYIQNNLPLDMYKDFSNKIRDTLLKNKIIQQVIAPTIKISRYATDTMAILANGKDAEITLYIAETDGINAKDIKQIHKLRNQLFQLKCLDPKNLEKYPMLKVINTKLTQLPVKQHSITRDLEVGQVSSIVQNGQHLQTLKLCVKKITDYPKEAQQQSLMLVGNQKLQLQAERYLKALYKRSYVEIK